MQPNVALGPAPEGKSGNVFFGDVSDSAKLPIFFEGRRVVSSTQTSSPSVGFDAKANFVGLDKENSEECRHWVSNNWLRSRQSWLRRALACRISSDM